MAKPPIPFKAGLTATKFTFFFEGGNNGWSESWYLPEVGREVRETAALVAAAERQQILAKPWKLKYVRVSNPLIRGAAQLIPVPANPNQQPDGGDDPWWAALVSLRGDADLNNTAREGYYRRNLLIRGLPATWTTTSAIATGNALNATGKAALSGWFRYLVTNQWRLKVLDKTSPVAFVSAVDKDPLSLNTRLTTTAANPFVAGDVLKMKGFTRGYKNLHGLASVLSATDVPTAVIIDRTFQSQVYFPFANIQRAEYTFANITSAEYGRLCKKSTGRPTVGTAGKSKTRPLSS